MKNSLLIKNCRPFYNLNSPIDIEIKDSKISKIGNVENYNGAILDAKGLILAPGLIDVHIQGAGGYDVVDNTDEAITGMSKTLAELGVTGFLATTFVKPQINNNHLSLLKKYYNKFIDGAYILGTHLEGPFINVLKKGGISESSIYSSSPEKLNEILELTGDSLKMMTIAPELSGNLEIIKKLKLIGVIPSFAHSTANYEETIAGIEAGINHVTHFFNAMNPINHRNPGPIIAIMENGKISCQIISDGHHLDGKIVKFIYNSIGAENCICITDGVQAMGLSDGEYMFNGRLYSSKNGAARYTDGTLIGSTTPLLKIVKIFIGFTGCSLEEGINSVTLNPSKLLKIEKNKGSIEVGKDADVILFDENFDNKCTIINGKILFNKI